MTLRIVVMSASRRSTASASRCWPWGCGSTAFDRRGVLLGAWRGSLAVDLELGSPPGRRSHGLGPV